MTKAKGGNKACGVAPTGYNWNDKAQIVIDDATSPTVELMFKKYAELESLGKVKKLDDNKIKTNRDKNFSKQAIKDISPIIIIII